MRFLNFLFNVFFRRCRPTKKHKTRNKPRQTESDNQNRDIKPDIKHFNFMNKLIHDIRHLTHDLMHDLEKYEQGNKTAGKRARKSSLELEKLYKEFRKRSVNEMPEKPQA